MHEVHKKCIMISLENASLGFGRIKRRINLLVHIKYNFSLFIVSSIDVRCAKETKRITARGTKKFQLTRERLEFEYFRTK